MSLSLWAGFAIVLFVFRYARLVGNLFWHWTNRPIPIPINPTYSHDDVTVIVPTIEGDGDELRRTLQTCLATSPWEILLVTVDASVHRAIATAEAVNSKKIRVLSVPKPNKRRQMCEAIPEVVTKITIFADDDVIWPRTLLPWILAPFEDDMMGGVGTSQRLVRPQYSTLGRWIISFLGALYLERRNFDCSACNHADGGLPCLSGRTVAYRTSILQDDAFTYGFTNETWRSYQLNADDDNFVTRWMFSRGWKIAYQHHKAAEVQTTLETGPKYLKQCLRWVRSNWRSNLTSMFVERHYCWTHWWTTYAVFQTTLTAWAIFDPIMLYAIWQASSDLPSSPRLWLKVAAVLWILVFAKCVKLMGHLLRYPADALMIPISIIFGYIHGCIKIYGAATLSETAWGSREGADTDDRYRMIKLPGYNLDDGAIGKNLSAPVMESFADAIPQRLPPYKPLETTALKPISCLN